MHTDVQAERGGERERREQTLQISGFIIPEKQRAQELADFSISQIKLVISLTLRRFFLVPFHIFHVPNVLTQIIVMKIDFLSFFFNLGLLLLD